AATAAAAAAAAQNSGGGNPAPANFTITQIACVPTSVEAWVRPTRDTSFVIYEEALEEERNRVTFTYDPRHRPVGGLVISLYDAGVECKDSKEQFTHLKRKPVEF